MDEMLGAPVRLVTDAVAHPDHEPGATGGTHSIEADRSCPGGPPRSVRPRPDSGPRLGRRPRPAFAGEVAGGAVTGGAVTGGAVTGGAVFDVVRRAPPFSALDDRAAADLGSRMTEVRLRRGQVLFGEGEVGDRLYVIAEGKIKLGCTSGDGRSNLLALLGPGEEFGELSLFDLGPRTATATAVTEARLHALSHQDLRPWLLHRPEVGLALLSQLARRLRRTTEVVGDLVFHDTPGRVAKVLLDLSARFGIRAEDGLHVTHDLTQEELAQLVGASRETVNKVLADFAGRGWLRPAARSVILLDVERLHRRAH